MFAKHRGTPLPTACALLALAAAPASADEAIEEITVVADFRERLAAELPPAISVLDRDAIEQRAVQHFEELVQAVPNMNYSGDGHRARYFQIRGVGELEQYEGAPNPSVGLLIDDIDFSGIGTVATLFDIGQIDVLRGPQGTRYGANALGGLIYVQSVEPPRTPSGRLEATAGGDSAFALGAAWGGPLGSDGLSYRVAAQHHESDGFRDNAWLGRDDTHGRKESLLRAKLAWEPGNDWFLRGTAMLADVDDGYDAFALDNSLTVLSDRPGRDAQRSLGTSLRAEWRGSDVATVTSITAAADSDIVFSFDADWGNSESWAPFTYDFTTANERERRTLSQEFRLASAEGGRLFDATTAWLLGAYALRLADELRSVNRGEYVDPVAGFESTLDDVLTSRFDASSVALFGQLDVDVGEAGLLTFGLRGERRTTDYRDSNGLDLGPGETMLGGELRYRHEVRDGVTAFAGLARGYKAGGFNLGVVPEGRRAFGREALWNLELGVRTAWLDERLAVDALVFLSRRRDQQARTSFQIDPNDPASFVFFTDNAASGTSHGLEASVRYTPNDAWQWYATLGLLDAEFDDFVTPEVDLGGRDQAHAPNYTLNAGGAYRHPSGWFARLDVTARDAFYFDVSHDRRSEAYRLVNARLGYESERWTAQLWARNVFDERYAVRGFYFGNEPPAFLPELYIRLGDPRQLGVTIERRF